MLAAAELDATGVCVVRGACEERTCASCLTEILSATERMLTLPAPISEATAEGTRHFVPIVPSSAAPKRMEHRRDFKLPLSPCVEAVLRAALSGGAGAVLLEYLGRDAELFELTAITSTPGAAAQEMHSDGMWSATGARQVTMFIALHDIDERMGPTQFCPSTHHPRCFPSERWLPPSEALVAEMGGGTCFEMRAGDAVLMDSLTWHSGGANTSDRRRTLLSATFEEDRARDSRSAATAKQPPAVLPRRGAQSLPRLGELMDGTHVS